MKQVDVSGCTSIMMTHDVDEAVLLSDRIAMMTHGPAATIGQILEVDIPHMRARLDLAQGRMICTGVARFCGLFMDRPGMAA